MIHDMFVRACTVLTSSNARPRSTRRIVRFTPVLAADGLSSLESRLAPSSMMMAGPAYTDCWLDTAPSLDMAQSSGVVPGTINTIISSESDYPNTDDQFSSPPTGPHSSGPINNEVADDGGNPIGSFPIDSMQSGEMLS